jgi:hypothetical protein
VLLSKLQVGCRFALPDLQIVFGNMRTAASGQIFQADKGQPPLPIGLYPPAGYATSI